MAFTDSDFKQIMAHWTTGIAVITTQDGGVYKGFTANSFASVSVNPLLISMSIAKTLNTLACIQNSGTFAVNILGQQQQYWGEVFAGMHKKDDRFEGIAVTLSENGNPLLPDVLGWMDCRVYKTIDVGASVLFLGEVTGGSVQVGGSPLAYFNRQWGTFAT